MASSPPVPDEPGPEPLAGGEDAGGRRIGRRTVLGLLGLGAAGVVVGSRVQSVVDQMLRPLAKVDGTGITSYLPGSGRFRIYSVVGFSPEPDPPYRLQVGGLVDTPTQYSLADVRTGLPQTSMTYDFQCVTGWRVEDVPWKGVRLSEILERAGVQDGATHVRFVSFDRVYSTTLTLEQAMRPDVLVAHQMLGAPVTRDHGGPVRLFVAPMYGYKSLKWLDEIQVFDSVADGLVPGYWEERGYDTDAWVGRSNGRSDEPTS